MPKFKVTLSPLQNVLTFTRSYQVPRYQRPYTWKVGRVEELWDDLVEGYKNQGRMGEEYLLGSIVTVECGEKAEVVDGQQRLVSLTLMFCALRDSLRVHQDQSSGEVEVAIQNLISRIECSIFDESGLLIELNNNDDQILFDAICRACETKDAKKNASKAFLQNYNKFCRRSENLYDEINIGNHNLTGVKKLNNIIDAITHRVFVVDIVAENEDEAGQIFQALNSKSQTLTQSDLIKNYLIQQSEGIETAWNAAFTLVEKGLKGKPEKADDYVYDSMISRYCQMNNKDVGKKYLYKAVKESRVKNQEAVKKFVAELKIDIEIIHKLENPTSDNSEMSHMLYGLKQLNARYFRRSIIAAVRLWGWDDRKTHSLIDLLLKFFFMYKTVLKKDIDKIRSIARNLTKKLVNCTGEIKITDLYEIVLEPIYKSQEKNKEDLEDFHKRFLDDFIVQQYRDNSIKYIFISIERDLQKEFNVVPGGYDVEHIFPQNADPTEWPNHLELKPYTNNIGNLTLLPHRWNEVLQNYSFKVKKHGIKNDGKKITIRGKYGKDPNGKSIIICYKNSKLELNRQIHSKKEWDRNEILDRQCVLRKYAESVWDLREYDDQVRNANKNMEPKKL